MKLNEAAIKVILQLRKGEGIEEGKKVYQVLFPTKAIPKSHNELIAALGIPLRQDLIPDRAYDEKTFSATYGGKSLPQTVQPTSPALQNVDVTEKVISGKIDGLSITAKLSFQETDLIRERAYHHQKMINASSDKERKQIRKDQEQNQARITEIRKLKKEAEKGNSVDLPVSKKDPMQKWSIIPDSLYDKSENIRKLSSLRSKRKKVIRESEKNSPRQLQAQKEFQHFDECIAALKDAKNQQIQQESASKST